MTWFKHNINWFGPTVAMFLLLAGAIIGIAADVLPRPARASDVEELSRITQEKFDRVADTLQNMAEIQTTGMINSEIRSRQQEVRTIRRDYSDRGGRISQESQIAIDTFNDEIEELRWQRDNPQ